MPIFTFMGANIMRLDDAYSFRVIDKTVQMVIPALIKVRGRFNPLHLWDSVLTPNTRVQSKPSAVTEDEKLKDLFLNVKIFVRTLWQNWTWFKILVVTLYSPNESEPGLLPQCSGP